MQSVKRALLITEFKHEYGWFEVIKYPSGIYQVTVTDDADEYAWHGQYDTLEEALDAIVSNNFWNDYDQYHNTTFDVDGWKHDIMKKWEEV